jgi:alpha-ketoglutarate-dependent taurine dioxygenase
MTPHTNILRKLVRDGWATFESSSPDATEFTLSALGPVIQKTLIAPRPNARAALATDLEMQLHTDHPRARWIGWHCVSQSSEGGVSLLKDARLALWTLPASTRAALAEVTMGSHQVFPRDLERWPVVRNDLGVKDWIFFTPWFRREGADEHLNAFVAALDQVETERVVLEPGQVLLIDNSRMLHGRTAIGGDKDRLLIRHWVGHPKDNFDREGGR